MTVQADFEAATPPSDMDPMPDLGISIKQPLDLDPGIAADLV